LLARVLESLRPSGAQSLYTFVVREGLLVGQFITLTTMVPGRPIQIGARERATSQRSTGKCRPWLTPLDSVHLGGRAEWRIPISNRLLINIEGGHGFAQTV
jgi:hypothetical protein